MADENVNPGECRPPTLEDLLTICRSLNAQAAKYIVIGGFAIMQHGFDRTTGDIDLLVEESPENQARVKRALETLPEKAILELGDDDLRNYAVVRVADEVLVDLMLAACGIRYPEASSDVSSIEIRGVPIPFANPPLLLRMKQTHREKDAEDRIFLHRKIAQSSQPNK
jgi:hypothetical protein